jgi:hypothetical protein
MKLIGQQESLWCWAASAEMVMDLLGTKVRQCEQANERLGKTTCCNAKTPPACIQTGWPEFPKYGFKATKNTTARALSWDELTAEIGCNKRPVVFSWQYTKGGGHMMVAIGYQVSAGVREVLIHDPLPIGTGDDAAISYDAYVASQLYSHWDDYYNIR